MSNVSLQRFYLLFVSFFLTPLPRSNYARRRMVTTCDTNSKIVRRFYTRRSSIRRNVIRADASNIIFINDRRVTETTTIFITANRTRDRKRFTIFFPQIVSRPRPGAE